MAHGSLGKNLLATFVALLGVLFSLVPSTALAASQPSSNVIVTTVTIGTMSQADCAKLKQAFPQRASDATLCTYTHVLPVQRGLNTGPTLTSSTHATSSVSSPNIALVGGNPWGCNARADNPHASGHGPADVNAQGWIICSGPGVPPLAGIDVSLYRQDCFLFICWWTDVSDSSITAPPVNWVRTPPSIVTRATYNCNGNSPHTFELDEYAWAEDAAGGVYDTNLASSDVSLNCG